MVDHCRMFTFAALRKLSNEILFRDEVLKHDGLQPQWEMIAYLCCISGAVH